MTQTGADSLCISRLRCCFIDLILRLPPQCAPCGAQFMWDAGFRSSEFPCEC